MKIKNNDLQTQQHTLFSPAFLMSYWAKEYDAYCASGEDDTLREKLSHWANKDFQKETASEGRFVQLFFVELWGYIGSGEQNREQGFTLYPQFPINNAGQRGGKGYADLALGWFALKDHPETPQVLCEFKDIRSGLDEKQNRKDNDRSPVQQCADYLHFARLQYAPYGHEKIQPTWGIVTDMNEFRLYWKAKMPGQYQRFILKPKTMKEQSLSLLADSEQARQQRFLFKTLFQADMLLNPGNESALLKLLNAQQIQEKTLEKTFYFEYRAYREALFKTLVKTNADHYPAQKLVRLTQKLLDRLLFIMFCEDMGAHLEYPVNLLRDLMVEGSQDTSYNPQANDFYEEKVARLFKTMRLGGTLWNHSINKFNGGLFAADDDLENLFIPNHIFFTPMQGATEQAMKTEKHTLLYFSANYNFGIEDGGERTIGLYTLGRIFEQSITDLEIMEAEAANEESLMKLSKRKTDGVYYTPEWVTEYVVEQTLGLRLRELQTELGFEAYGDLTDLEIDAAHTKSGKFVAQKSRAKSYFEALEHYEARLSEIKVLDPACGSGAFLIQALKRLLKEHEAIGKEKARISYEFKQGGLFDVGQVYRDILSKNLYGVDINPESVEITKLALWLHTVMPGQPLSSLDNNILCGNSLVDWDIQTILPDLNEHQLAKINPFSYAEAFQDVFANGGFDVIIGNPPYIKLQNMKKVAPEATEYWVKATKTESLTDENGQVIEKHVPKFRSTQTGNYDIYLPFFEQSVQLINPKGRMGFIAPSVWAVNEYGAGLRAFLHQSQQMDRWIDFKSYQIFDEAITYTALQFFTGQVNDGIKLHFAPQGADDLAGLHWDDITPLPYHQLDPNQAWQFMPEVERVLINKLFETCPSLKSMTTSISQGLVTSANDIYHLTQDDQRFIVPKNVFITESEVVRPLISGKNVSRYALFNQDVSIIIPYDLQNEKASLLSEDVMRNKYPVVWKYLKTQEHRLRNREYPKMDNDSKWWGYVYPKNLTKQGEKKLFVAGTAPELRVAYDEAGLFAADDKRVYTIHAENQNDLIYLLGILNAPVASYIFKKIARPKAGGFFDIESQYLAPLPIPNANDQQKAQIGELAQTLQNLHSEYRDKLAQFDKRLTSTQMLAEPKDLAWLWADIQPINDLKKSDQAKATGLKGKELTEWAKQQAQKVLDKNLQPLASQLNAKTKLVVQYQDGELSLLANGIEVITQYITDEQAALIVPQWRQVIRTTNITPSVTADKLVGHLLNLKTTHNASLIQQLNTLDTALATLQTQIQTKETQLNQHTYQLYNLTQNEIALIEGNV
ncbi:Eco57I restriction-modification methylase domain-containing protein [Thiomicrospira microaerophila]|uniref:Eco57I restriction-modification methylase domain-containing protein n=1 Tax=Thiomicrospira microaerophila TaxID=406020 RepID=UPI00200BEBC3|nr:DNA methyltransferase [Thiomicrospira microaerophila]UQB41881.1 Eco57I restriction-modification methylase domain-containing protein [Thiomicrospira microaerophila]